MSKLQNENINLCSEKIELEKVEWKKKLDDTILQMREDFQLAKTAEIQEAVQVEKQTLKKQLDEQRLVYEKKLNDLNSDWSLKLNLNQQELRLKLTHEFEKKTQSAVEKATLIQIEAQDLLKNMYEQELVRKSDECRQIIAETNELNLKLVSAQSDNEKLKKHIEQMKREYQKSIERFTSLKENGADFLFTFDQ
jgi:hypothetical protein